jgi:RNA polymerase sigma factor (sigma-70 family)
MAQAAEFGERVAGGVAGAATGLTAEWLCETYALPVYRFASMLSRGDVEAADLAQDTLERAVRRLRTYDADRGSVDTWLWKLAVSAAADAGRIAGRRSRLLWRLQYFHARDDDVALDIADSLADEDLLTAVRALPERDRAIISLRFGGGLSFGEVGHAVGISEAAAGVACRRALARLRGDLLAHGGGGQR